MEVNGWTIVTGATGAMGSAAVRALVADGRAVIMACRNVEAADTLRKHLLEEYPQARLAVHYVDLSLPETIRAFAAEMKGRQLAALFNNAGVMCRRFRLTDNGREWTMGVNFYGTAQMSLLIAPMLPEGGHIVNMVSLSARFVSWSRDMLSVGEDGFSQLGSYARSKLALVLFTVGLSLKYPSLRVNMSDPGIVDTDMIRLDRWFDGITDIIFRPFCNSPSKGVRPALRALQSEETCRCFIGDKCGIVPRKYLNNSDIDWLMEETAHLAGVSQE